MRNLYLKLATVAVCLFAMAACARDAATEGEPSGTLDLGSIVSSIVETTRAAETRAVDPGNFTVRVWCTSSGDVAAGSWLFSECSGKKVALPVGKYRMEISSSGVQPAAWESPWYVGRVGEFTISKNATTGIGNVKCTLGNIKVTVHYGTALQEMLDKSSVKTTVSVGPGSLEYRYGEKRGGYFASAATSMTVIFDGIIDGTPTTYSGVVNDVAPGEWERVFIDIEREEGGPVRLIVVYGSEAGQITGGEQWF